jgi:hypothetical protein
MADKINIIVPKEAIDSIIKLNDSIIKLDNTYMKLLKDIQAGQEILKSQKTTFKDLSDHQKTIKKTTEQLTEAEKQQKKAVESLEKQRQRGLAAMAKQEAKERELIKAATKEIKSVDDLKARIKALTTLRDRLDKSTKEGKKKFDELTQSIKKNRQELKSTSTATGGLAASFQKSFLKIGIAVAAVIGIYKKFSGFITDSIEKFDQQQLAEVALSTALGKVSKKLLDQASAFQKLTRFGDEETIRGQAFLAQMGLTEKQILRIIPRILDFAQAKGIDLKIAADLVAKSIGSETNALSRYGIQIEGAAGSQERLESAFSALDGKFKGQAAAALTGAGALKQLSNTWGDLMERVGGFIAQAINPAIKAINNFLTANSDVIEELQTEKREVNNLLLSIRSLNEGNRTRTLLIEKLNTKYPDLLKNLELDKITNQDLLDIQKEYNKEFLKRIELAVFEKELTELKQRQKELDKEAIKAVEVINRSYKFYLSDIKEGATIEEKIKALRESGNRTAIIQVDTWAKTLADVTTEYESINTEIDKIVNKQEKIKTDPDPDGLKKRKQIYVEFLEAKKAVTIDYEADDIDRMDENNEARNEQIILQKQKELELEQNVNQAKFDLALQTSDALFSIFSGRLDAQMEKNESDRQRELQRAGNDAKLKDEINNKFDKKAAALKTKAAKADKAQALFSIAINTAMGVTNALSKVVTAFLVPFIIASGALQAAVVAARPIPKFKHGTHGKHDTPDTFITSEKGAGTEWIETAGKIIQTDKPTLHTNKKGSRVYSESELKRYPNKEIQSLIKNKDIGFDSIDLKGVIESNKEIVKAIKNQKQYIVNNGKITGFKQSNYKRTYIERMTNGN